MNIRKWRRTVNQGAALAISGALLSFAVCTDSENFHEFRLTAGPGLESGVQQLLDGDDSGFELILDSVVAGLFEILEPDSS